MGSNANTGDGITTPFHFGLTDADTNALSLQTTLESDIHSIWAVKNPICKEDEVV